MSKLVTIIIPIYNSEKYLEECLKSVTNQMYKNIEILCVDNGSTDKSTKILDEYKNKDARIRTIRLEEKGVSKARNIGIEQAKGDYVLFVDSDDIIDVTMVEKLLNIANAQNSDMVICTNSLLNSKNKERKIGFDIDFDETVNIIKEKKEKAFEYMYSKGIAIQVWNKLIKKSMLEENNIKFYESMSYDEDMFFCWKCTINSNIINITKDTLYKYRLTNGSAITKYHSGLANDYKKAFIDISNELTKKDIDSKYINRITRMIYSDKIKVLITMESRNKESINKKIKNIKNIIRNNENKDFIKKDDKMYFMGITKNSAIILLIWANLNKLKYRIARLIK